MSTIYNYELLKTEGTWIDRVQYILSLADKHEIEQHLQQSSSYEDLQMLIFLLKSTKNDKHLLDILKTSSIPVGQRVIAGRGWLKIQQDEKQIYELMVEIILDTKNPPFLKHQLLKNLYRIDCLKHSSSFFYNLACRLTKSSRYDQYQLDKHLLPYCSHEQIIDLFSRWAITGLEQFGSSSVLMRSKLISSQPLIIIHLIRCDLNEKKTNKEQFSRYFDKHYQLLSLLAVKDAKAVCRLTIEYVNQFDPHQRFLPCFMQSQQKYLFKKAPDEMIELMIIVASNQPGTIKYKTFWQEVGADLQAFHFPRSFSLDHYLRLFIALYHTCQWSSHHTIRLLQYMLQDKTSLSSLHKRRKWLVDIVIHQHIGKDLFMEKLLEEGNMESLICFEEYTEITTPLAVHLLAQTELNRTASAKERLGLLRYQSMTPELFNQLLNLFNQTSSNASQREQNYILLLQCAFSTSDEQVKNVLQWIEKQFVNERLVIIEAFLRRLSEFNIRFQLEVLPDNLPAIEAIIELALRHLQKSNNILQILVDYGLLLLKRIQDHRNKEQTEKIQGFAEKIIKRCFSLTDCLTLYIQKLSRSYPIARAFIANLLISDMFPKLLSKCLLDDLNTVLCSYFDKPWRLPQIDTFINSFFVDHLPSTQKLQMAFQIEAHSSIISLFLKERTTQIERVDQLVNKIDKIFFLNETVQRIALRSQQYRHLIDSLVEDNQSVTLEKLSDATIRLTTTWQIKLTNKKFPGLHLNILNRSFPYLTGNEQEHITKIIFDDFLQDKEVSNPKKVKSLRALHYFTHTYRESLQWFDKKQMSSSLSLNNKHGRNIDSLDNITICIPVRFDLSIEDYLKQFHVLKTKLNAANAKFISDAMLTIARRIPADLFLEHYLEFVRSEEFQRLGITANKEILRLLNEYASNSSLIRSIIKPLWNGRPHQDVRACLVLTALQFIDKLQSDDEKTIVWKILEEAADDNYLPVVQSLFAAHRGTSRWPLSNLIHSSEHIYRTFINRIQFKILDHPTSLEARFWAWSNIDCTHCDSFRLIEKGIQLCTQFNKETKTLWECAFDQIMSACGQHKISSVDTIVDTIQKLMSRRDDLDSKENAVDAQHDLPVYHRIHRILTKINARNSLYDSGKQLSFRPLVLMILQFDKTFAFLIGSLLIRTAQSRDDLESILTLLQEQLSENYFERVLLQLATVISKSCSYIQNLNVKDKFDLVQWFIQDKNQGLLVFDLLKNHVFKKSGIDREQCQKLLRQIRQSDNLLLRQQALGYTVCWGKKKEKRQQQQRRRDRTAETNPSSDSDMSALNLFDVFDTTQSS